MNDDENLKINITKYTKDTEFVPYYDPESNILEIKNRLVYEWPYGFDIDGNIIFDLDKQKELSNVDILIPKELWKVEDRIDNYFNMNQEKATLTFPNSVLEKKSLSIPINVYTDKKNNFVLIRIGSCSNIKVQRVISLSKNCLAIVSSNTLVGFNLKL